MEVRRWGITEPEIPIKHSRYFKTWGGRECISHKPTAIETVGSSSGIKTMIPKGRSEIPGKRVNKNIVEYVSKFEQVLTI